MQLESLRTGLLVEAMHPRNGQSRLSPGIQTLSAGQSLDLYMKQMAWTLPKRCLSFLQIRTAAGRWLICYPGKEERSVL